MYRTFPIPATALLRRRATNFDVTEYEQVEILLDCIMKSGIGMVETEQAHG